MYVFTCEDNITAAFTAIYDAWEKALVCGHDYVRLMKEPVLQPGLFDEYIHVESDVNKAEKVARSVRRDISNAAYIYAWYACQSAEKDALDAVYSFLRIGFKKGADVVKMLTEPSVMRVAKLKQNVGNEAHYFREFARFSALDNNIYVCHMEPKNNILMCVGYHFSDRMPSEHWIIVDDNRRLVVVHPKDEEMYLKNLGETEFEALSKTECYEDAYTDLWRSFFHSIGIKERLNPDCQRTMFPLWMRKHAVEFMEDKHGR